MFKLSRKILSMGLVGALIIGGVGFLTFGTSFGSYMRSSLGLVKSSVKDSIPIEFEIQRARDLLEDLIPEMRANLRLVATEEVEVANLEREIDREHESIDAQRNKLQTLRETLKTQEISYKINNAIYHRTELVDIMATQFDRLTMAEKFLSGKESLLKNRHASLSAAMKNLEKTRFARLELQSQIESLEEQFRLLQLQSSGKNFHLDNTKLSQVQKVISELKNRLDVTEKIMASEARFIDNIPIEETISEDSVLDRVDTYFLKAHDETPRSEVVIIPAN